MKTAVRKLSSAQRLFRRAVRVGAITPDQRNQIISSSVLAGHYEKAIDRESAYEKLQARAGEKAQTAGAPAVAASAPAPEGNKGSLLAEALGTVTAAFQPTIGPRGAIHDSLATSMTKSADARCEQPNWPATRSRNPGRNSRRERAAKVSCSHARCATVC
jgi:hypothetical protein